MSVTASIFVLFREVVSQERIAAIEEVISSRTGVPAPAGLPTYRIDEYDRFLPVFDAELRADVSEDGILNMLDRERMSKLLGEPSIEGRLFENSYMSRHWSESCPHGPAMQFALTMLTLLAQPDVQWVWYTSEYNEGLTKPMTRADVHQLIDDFVRIGVKE